MNDLEVRAAFARACSTIRNPASKSKGNFGKYCQLDDLADHVRPALAEHGLALHQELRSDIVAGANEIVTIVTSLETGVWIEVGRVAFPAKPDAMKAGGDVTYYRRYSQMAALNIAGDEDIERGAKPAVSRSKPSNDQPSVPRPVGQISSAQLKALQTRYSTMERPERLALWAERIGRPVESANDLSKADAILLLTDDEGASHV
jgi:hypothetical protein